MAISPFRLRERFHLCVLRGISARLAGRGYALKGGICLRFFHRSPRLSHDMDLDVLPQVRRETIRKAVETVLHSRWLLASLAPHGVLGVEATTPKQTDTTQRWKIALRLGPDLTVPTRIEFSRRSTRIPSTTGVPDAELLQDHQMVPFAAQYYGAPTMAALKIAALASPTRFATRDLFDLHHLLRTVGVPPDAVVRSVPLEAQLRQALAKIRDFRHSDFQEQVLPFLPETLQVHYRRAAAFEQLRQEVLSFLEPIVS